MDFCFLSTQNIYPPFLGIFSPSEVINFHSICFIGISFNHGPLAQRIFVTHLQQRQRNVWGRNEIFQNLVLKLSLLSMAKLLVMAEFDQLKSYYVSLWEILPFIAFIVFSWPASNKMNESKGLYFKRKEWNKREKQHNHHWPARNLKAPSHDGRTGITGLETETKRTQNSRRK